MGILNAGSLASLNSTLVVSNLANINTLAISIVGTWSGTITFQGTVADGGTFSNLIALSVSNGLFVGTTSANGAFLLNCVGMQSFQIKMTSYTSGTTTCEISSATGNMIQNTLASLVGATDGTRIGNTSDRLKVDSSFSTAQRVTPAYIGSKVTFDDMNASTGGVARDTSITSTTVYTQLYAYTGNGNLFAFTVSFEGNLIGSDPFNIKLEIDGVTCWEINTLDLGTSTFWSLTTIGDEATMGLSLNGNTLRFAQVNGSLRYETGVKIYIKKAAGGSKRFRGGMIYLTKE